MLLLNQLYAVMRILNFGMYLKVHIVMQHVEYKKSLRTIAQFVNDLLLCHCLCLTLLVQAITYHSVFHLV